MAYGALLKNGAQVSILNDKEVPLLYWGKLTVTAPTYVSGGSNTITVDLFNLPSNVPLTVFVRVTANTTESTGVSVAPVWIDKNGTHSKLKIVNTSYYKPTVTQEVSVPATIEAYVFVPAKYIPLPKYGLMIKNLAGDVIFHSGRPPISVKTIVSSKLDAYSATPSNISFKGAAQATVVGVLYLSSGWPNNPPDLWSWEGWVFHTTCVRHKGSSQDTVGVQTGRRIYQRGSNTLGAVSYANDPNTIVSVPVIDAAYYDQFSSLPNYS